MFELKDDCPDSFEVRKAAVSDKSSRLVLIVGNERTYAAVRPGDYIVFDSLGRAQIYGPDFFGMMFRRAEYGIDAEALGRRLFELNAKNSSGYDLKQANLLLEEFIIVRRDADKLFLN